MGDPADVDVVVDVMPDVAVTEVVAWVPVVGACRMTVTVRVADHRRRR
jgi:hypothetical protein